MKLNYNNRGHLPRIAIGTIILVLLLLAGGANATIIPTIDSPANGSSFLQGEIISFQGNVSGGTSPFNYSWTSSIDGLIGNVSTIDNSPFDGNRTHIFNFSLSIGTHVITMTVNDSDGGTNSTSATITINTASTTNISGQSATGGMTWNASNFPALTTETLYVRSVAVRDIVGNDLWYNTTKQLVPYKVFSATGNTVVNGESGGGYYAKVGWFGKTYVALRGQTRKLAKPLLEQNETENKTLLVGETWDMGDGYTLKLRSTDVAALPLQAWVILNKSGIELDDKVIANGSVYTYVERTIGGESNVPMFVTYFDNISANSVRLKYTWLISGNNILELGAADRFGNLEVMTASTDAINMTNKDTSITLSQDSTQNIGYVLRFRVNNTGTLEYYPEMTVISSGGIGASPSFVTAHPIRALTRNGTATRVPTNVSFYYNGSIIQVNVSLNQSGLNVSGDFSPVGNGTINTTTYYQNASNEYIYTLTATAGNVGVGAQPITITAANTSTGANNTNVFIALMNIDPLVFDTTLGGTNWTGIDDFTYTRLIFEKFNDPDHSISIGKLEFLDPMNLADQTTGEALSNLSENLNISATSMGLNSAADALAAMNVSSRLVMYNLTMFTSPPGILMNGVPVVMSGQTSGGGVSGYGWYPNYTLVFTVSHWTNYSSDGQPPVVTFVSPTPDDVSTNTTGNVTIQVSLNENGTSRLNWQGVNETMTGIAPDTGRNFSINKTGLLSGNYTFRVYANDSVGNPNATETRTITIDRSNTTNIADLGYINTTNATVTTAIILTAPDTNVTVDVPVGTVARNASGGALTNITTDSIADVGSSARAAASSASLSFLGKNLSLGPEGATFVPDIQIRFNYTHADLPEGVLEGNLKVKWYNKTSGVWDTLTPYDYNTTANYIIVNVSHFSTFALLGTVTTTTVTSSGGGGGGPTGENYSNILVKENYDLFISKDVITSYAFTNKSSPVKFVNITGNTSAGIINVAVETLKNTSTLVKTPVHGLIYKNVNIWVGTTGFAVPRNIKEAAIVFRVENSWLGSSNLAGSDIKMFTWDGNQWTQLETAQTTKDDTYTWFEAKTDHFSPFAISGIKGGVVPTATPAAAETQVMPTVTPAPTKKVPAFEFVLTIAILSMAYMFGKKRR